MWHVTFCMWHVTLRMSHAYLDPRDILNNFCLHVYAQKWIFVIMSHVTFRLSHVTCYICQMLIVDPWDMLNNFCFDVFAQKWVFVILSHVECHMSYIKYYKYYILNQGQGLDEIIYFDPTKDITNKSITINIFGAAQFPGAVGVHVAEQICAAVILIQFHNIT